MDQATAFLAALRAAAALSPATPLPPARVEAMAGTLGLDPATLPALVAELQRREEVTLEWGGALRILPEKPVPGPSMIAHASPGAVVNMAGRDATMGDVNTGGSAALGQIAALLAELRAVRPTLDGEAAATAAEAEAVLAKAAKPETPADERKGLMRRALDGLGGLLGAAPQVKALVEVGEKVFKALG